MVWWTSVSKAKKKHSLQAGRPVFGRLRTAGLWLQRLHTTGIPSSPPSGLLNNPHLSNVGVLHLECNAIPSSGETQKDAECRPFWDDSMLVYCRRLIPYFLKKKLAGVQCSQVREVMGSTAERLVWIDLEVHTHTLCYSYDGIGKHIENIFASLLLTIHPLFYHSIMASLNWSSDDRYMYMNFCVSL